MELKTKVKLLLFFYNYFIVIGIYLLVNTLLVLVYDGLINNQKVDLKDISLFKAIIFSAVWSILSLKKEMNKYKQIERNILKTNGLDSMERVKEIITKNRWKFTVETNGGLIFIPRYRIFNIFGKIIVREEESSIKVMGPEIYVDLFVDKYFDKYKKPIIRGNS